RGIRAAPDFAPVDEAFQPGSVANQHAMVRNASDFDDFPIIGEDGFTMIRIGVVDAIEEADPVANRERKVIGVAAAIGGLDDLDVVAEVTGATSLSTDGRADLSRVGVCRRRDGEGEIAVSVVRLEALTP